MFENTTNLAYQIFRIIFLTVLKNKWIPPREIIHWLIWVCTIATKAYIVGPTGDNINTDYRTATTKACCALGPIVTVLQDFGHPLCVACLRNTCTRLWNISFWIHLCFWEHVYLLTAKQDLKISHSLTELAFLSDCSSCFFPISFDCNLIIKYLSKWFTLVVSTGNTTSLNVHILKVHYKSSPMPFFQFTSPQGSKVAK